ncbi:zinc finger protein family memeber [Trypanosoma rangeli]|uniref:Zinc finger protein family memeber n=1 Tax=Trypanosoma rangeli TaxID=5698 RepID=A0A422P0P0_TRYRA|nr:zinc finger protein family memeber [Trypanosoma rangeli]RNF11234.1 zinc finger protein family memeber [Trypanosoma rangeli]|eukprot:RNF11234.1 zinc finger protein family memeber [Trypanosoma rangeli]
MPSKQSAPNKTGGNLLEVFDCDFKTLYLMPSHLVVHTPPARLNISRLVKCRSYKPNEWGSCSKGENCRFVHANVDYLTLESKPIHVNYIWRDEELCIYERLPPGDVLEVYSRNKSKKPDLIPSERILVTRRALLYRKDTTRSLSHCAHYYCDRICNRGKNCDFIHAVYVDPNVASDFKRPPARMMSRFYASADPLKMDNLDFQAPWTNQINSSLLSHRCPSPKEDVASQLLSNTQTSDFLPFNGEPREATVFSMNASQSSIGGARSLPLTALGKSFTKSIDFSGAGNDSLREENVSRKAKYVQPSALGAHTPVTQTPMMFSLVLSHDLHGALPLSDGGMNNISSAPYKAFDASSGQSFLGGLDGLTVSPPASLQGTGNLSVFSTASASYQMPFNSGHEASFAVCRGVIGEAKDVERPSGSMERSTRVYRHNPYKSIDKFQEFFGGANVEK